MKTIEIDGQTFELVPSDHDQENPLYYLRVLKIAPVTPVEPEWEVILTEWMCITDPNEIQIKLPELNLEQAEALKASIETLMEYIFLPVESINQNGTPEPNFDAYTDGNFISKADEARILLGSDI